MPEKKNISINLHCRELSMRRIIDATNCPCDELSMQRLVHAPFLSIFDHVVLQSTVHNMHHFFTSYVLLFGRNIAGNLCIVCCFFMTTHLVTSPTSHRFHQIEPLCIFSRSCTQRLSSVLRSEIFFVAGIVRPMIPLNHYLESFDSDSFFFSRHRKFR